MNRNDILWKGILENLFEHFLRFFYAEHIALFDFSKGFEFLDKELEEIFPSDNIKAPKFVDKLVKVFTTDGREEWILIHIEVQGGRDKGFAERMHTYFYRILDKYGKKVAAMAIFSDDSKTYRPNVFEYEFLGTRNVFHFNTYKILDQGEEALLRNDNPFAIVILTVLLALKNKKVDDEKLAGLKLKVIKSLLYRKISNPIIRALITFIKLYVVFADVENSIKFDKEIHTLTTGKTKTMGIEELVLHLAEGKGIEIGVEKSAYLFVKNLLSESDFSVAKIASVANVSESFVRKVKREINKK